MIKAILCGEKERATSWHVIEKMSGRKGRGQLI